MLLRQNVVKLIKLNIEESFIHVDSSGWSFETRLLVLYGSTHGCWLVGLLIRVRSTPVREPSDIRVFSQLCESFYISKCHVDANRCTFIPASHLSLQLSTPNFFLASKSFLGRSLALDLDSKSEVDSRSEVDSTSEIVLENNSQLSKLCSICEKILAYWDDDLRTKTEDSKVTFHSHIDVQRWMATARDGVSFVAACFMALPTVKKKSYFYGLCLGLKL